MISFTPSQKNAVERTKGDVFVSAAAGSGKTAVLVERIVNIITNQNEKVEADSILVVTFTKAAASELSAKIKRRLEQQLKENPSDSWLKRQMNLIKQANISTIHSFCMSLIKEYWNRVDIPRDFTIIDEFSLADLKEVALTRAGQILYSNEYDFSTYSDLFGRARSDSDALKTIDQFMRFSTDIANLKEWSERFLIQQEKQGCINQSYTGKLMLSYVAKTVEAAAEMMTIAFEIIQKDEKLQSAYSNAFTEDNRVIYELKGAVEEADWDGCINILERYKPLSLGNSKGSDPILRESAKGLRDRVKKILSSDIKRKYLPITEEEFKQDSHINSFAFTKLLVAYEIYSKELDKLKYQHRSYEYSDLERYTIELLETDSTIRKEINSRYTHILVDEYQDTNEVQEKLLKLLKGEKTALFAVGDVKQSIYGFRRADPEIFINARKNAFTESENKYPAHILLNENFRSEAEVIDAVNSIFNVVMTKDMSSISYSDTEKLTTGKTKDTSEAGIEVRLLGDCSESEYSEAQETARLIRNMIDSSYLIKERDINGAIKTRPCEPKDFCVMMRTRDKIKEFSEAFESYKLPHKGDSVDKFLESSEIKVIISLLTIIDNPKRDIEMCSVMLSPLFGFSSDDILNLKKDNTHTDMFTLLLSHKQEDTRIRYFLDKLEEFRYIACCEPLDKLLIDIIDELDAELLLCAGEGYISRRENIRILIDIASSQSDKGNMSLFRFLKILQKNPASFASKSSYVPSIDAVDIITIHRAKGLEWPIVFIVDVNRGFNYTDLRQPQVIFDRNLGIGIKRKVEIGGANSPLAMKSTFQYKAIAAGGERKRLGEECRILYVALTRAKQKVFVTATVKKLDSAIPDIRRDKTPIPYLVAENDNFLSWILYGVNDDKNNVLTALNEQGEYKGTDIYIRVVPKEEERQESKDVIATSADENEIIDGLKRQINHVYPLKKLNELPVKLSVTEIASNGDYIAPIPFFMNEDKMSSAERGSILHSYLQYADLQKVSISPELELERLIEEGYIRSQHAKAIDIEKIKKFLSSDLGKRITSAEIQREYPFMDTIPASDIDKEISMELMDETIMVQGIVDLLLFEGEYITIVDYKSDIVDNPLILKERYMKQLQLYKHAIERCFNRKVTNTFIYSFHLNEAIEV